MVDWQSKLSDAFGASPIKVIRDDHFPESSSLDKGFVVVFKGTTSFQESMGNDLSFLDENLYILNSSLFQCSIVFPL